MANWFTAQQIATLLDEHSAALELFAAQWTDAPEDCVQEAMLELMRQSESPRNIAAWLFYVVKLRALSANRSATRRRRHETLAARLIRVSTDGDDPPFNTDDLARALELLDDEGRQIVVARAWGGLGFAALGELLGTSAATAFRRYEASLQILRVRLEPTCTKTDHPNQIPPKSCPTN